MSEEALNVYTIVNQRFRGRHDVAEITGAAPNSVAQWYRNGVPAKFWPALVGAAEARALKGVTFDALAGAMRGGAQTACSTQAVA